MNKAIPFAHSLPWHHLVLPFSAFDKSGFVRRRRRDAGEVLCVIGRFRIGGRRGGDGEVVFAQDFVEKGFGGGRRFRVLDGPKSQ